MYAVMFGPVRAPPTPLRSNSRSTSLSARWCDQVMRGGSPVAVGKSSAPLRKRALIARRKVPPPIGERCPSEGYLYKSIQIIEIPALTVAKKHPESDAIRGTLSGDHHFRVAGKSSEGQAG